MCIVSSAIKSTVPQAFPHFVRSPWRALYFPSSIHCILSCKQLYRLNSRRGSSVERPDAWWYTGWSLPELSGLRRGFFSHNLENLLIGEKISKKGQESSTWRESLRKIIKSNIPAVRIRNIFLIYLQHYCSNSLSHIPYEYWNLFWVFLLFGLIIQPAYTFNKAPFPWAFSISGSGNWRVRLLKDPYMPPPASNFSTLSDLWVMMLFGGTSRVTHTLPPIIDPFPITIRPRIVASE